MVVGRASWLKTTFEEIYKEVTSDIKKLILNCIAKIFYITLYTIKREQ